MNPFKPGNGVEPAYLAGREENISEFIKSLKAAEECLPRNAVVYGLRGTGKTVLLRRYKLLAEANGWLVLDREFLERYCDEKEFAQIFGKDIATAASEVSIKKRLGQTGKRLFDFLKPEELSAYGITYKPFYSSERDVLEDYLADSLRSNWPVFQKAGKKGVLLLYDEFHLVKDKREYKQYVLSSLLSAVSAVQREGCNYYFCVSGLPALKTNLKESKTYSERMFIYQELGNLHPPEAKKALTEPLKRTDCSFEGSLVAQIIDETRGYPYFLQFYGYFLLDTLNKKRFSPADLKAHHAKLLKLLDQSFFEDRFNLAAPKERQILAAMANASKEEKIPAAAIARKAGINYAKLQSFLVRLTEKGLIYRAERGHYAFSIPLFKDYLLRQ